MGVQVVSHGAEFVFLVRTGKVMALLIEQAATTAAARMMFLLKFVRTHTSGSPYGQFPDQRTCTYSKADIVRLAASRYMYVRDWYGEVLYLPLEHVPLKYVVGNPLCRLPLPVTLCPCGQRYL